MDRFELTIDIFTREVSFKSNSAWWLAGLKLNILKEHASMANDGILFVELKVVSTENSSSADYVPQKIC